MPGMTWDKDEKAEGCMANKLSGDVLVAWVPARGSAGSLISFALLIS